MHLQSWSLSTTAPLQRLAAMIQDGPVEPWQGKANQKSDVLGTNLDFLLVSNSDYWLLLGRLLGNKTKCKCKDILSCGRWARLRACSQKQWHTPGVFVSFRTG